MGDMGLDSLQGLMWSYVWQVCIVACMTGDRYPHGFLGRFGILNHWRFPEEI